MKVGYFIDANKFSIGEKEKPIIKENESLIKVKACGFCGSEKHNCTRKPTHPQIFGHEFSGIVEEIDREHIFKRGDKVIVNPVITCGVCSSCREGKDNICQNKINIGYGYDGAFAEFVKVPGHNLYRKPDNISFEEAALIEPLAVALHGLEFIEDISRTRGIIFGAGTIGLLTARLSALRKPKEVFLVDINERHLELAEGLENVTLVNASKKGSYNVLNEVNIEWAIESVGGNTPTLVKAIESVRKGGLILLIGCRGKDSIHWENVRTKELRIQGVYGFTRRIFQESINLGACSKVL